MDFRVHQVIGNPISTVARLSNWNVDELVVLDISQGDGHDMRRDDHFVSFNAANVVSLLEKISEVCCMPLAFGGRIRTIEDIQVRLAAGADKCIINSQAVREPEFITAAAERFGSQCIVVSIDARRHPDGRLEVFSEDGQQPTGMHPADWARQVMELGAGEIFLNSIDRDGAATGYDLDLVRQVSDAVSIPVIACGGVGSYDDFVAGVSEGHASAVSAANFFHFFELAYPWAKKRCRDAGIPMRDVGLSSRWFPREPSYDYAQRDTAVAERLKRAGADLGPARVLDSQPKMQFCKQCVYPANAVTHMTFDEEGVCMGCRTSNQKIEISREEWDLRKQRLYDILDRNRSRDGARHDCIIAVSGGKDSYFQTHYVKNVLGLNPLLVTYYGNNFSEAGHRNLYRMKEAFGLDHIIYSPSVDVLRKLNRLGFIVQGDMNLHNHIGIATLPMKLAVLHKIPIVVWGEHGWLDLSGQFSMHDFVEWSYRHRLEHDARGFEWNYFLGMEGLRRQDLYAYEYPSDQDIFDLDLRGIYLGNYVPWDANEQTKLVTEKYGWEASPEAFDRTYRRISNLDDIHENGVHDYMKYIKFGYGRCTDHASKDIRAGVLSRQEAVELVRRHDPVKPRDLQRWLSYVGMSEDEFDRIADTFRDPRVWRRDGEQWVKDNLWD